MMHFSKLKDSYSELLSLALHINTNIAVRNKARNAKVDVSDMLSLYGLSDKTIRKFLHHLSKIDVCELFSILTDLNIPFKIEVDNKVIACIEG